MSKFLSEALLQGWFTKSELAVLVQLPEFIQRREEAETAKEFEELCLLGCELLDKQKVVSRSTLSVDDPRPLAAEIAA